MAKGLTKAGFLEIAILVEEKGEIVFPYIDYIELLFTNMCGHLEYLKSSRLVSP